MYPKSLLNSLSPKALVLSCNLYHLERLEMSSHLSEWLSWPRTAVVDNFMSYIIDVISFSSPWHCVIVFSESKSNKNNPWKNKCLQPVVAKDIPWNTVFFVICASELLWDIAEKSSMSLRMWSLKFLDERLGSLTLSLSLSLCVSIEFWVRL